MFSQQVSSNIVRKVLGNKKSLGAFHYRRFVSATKDSKVLLNHPEFIRTSWLRSVISEVIPLTCSIINTYHGGTVENLAAAVSYCPTISPKNATEGIGKRRIDDSWIEMILPFSGDKNLCNTLVKSDGKTMRYGKLFEILDGLAADVAYRHCGGPSKDLTIVTASVDRMKLLHPISLVNDLKLQAYLTYVGKSSMEVTIDLISIKETGEVEYLGNTQFIMVARKGDRAATVHGIELEKEEAKSIFEQGKQRLDTRKKRAATSLELLPPRAEEISLIHELYLASKKIREINELATIRRNGTVEVSSSTASALNNQAALLANEERQALIDEKQKYIWMNNLVFKNIQYMHMQNRNIHGKVFGGYIMRAAFELAWVAAACYMGEKSTKFVYVDDIQFVKPVNVASIVEFTSAVIYSQNEYVVVEVEAVDVSPINISRTKTNVMHYIFTTEDANKKLPHIMPSTYEEIVNYLQGKRSLDKLLGEKH